MKKYPVPDVLDMKTQPGKNPGTFGTPLWISLTVGFYPYLTWDNPHVKIVHALLPSILPCKTCRQNHHRFRDESVIKLDETPFEWCNEAHNFVNRLHGKPVFSLEQAKYRTETLFARSEVWCTAYFKIASILIAHHSPDKSTPEFLKSLAYILPFDPVIKKRIETVMYLLNAGCSKENAIYELHKQSLELFKTMNSGAIAPTLKQYHTWFTEACYGDMN